MTTKQSKLSITSSIEENGDVFHDLTFADGSKGVVHIKHDSPLLGKFVEHGSKSKLLAAANSAKDVEDARAKVAAITAAFKEGKWSLVNESTEPKVGILAQALAALKGCSLEEAQAFVATQDRAAQAKLRAAPQVAAKIVELNATNKVEEAVGDALSGFLGA